MKKNSGFLKRTISIFAIAIFLFVYYIVERSFAQNTDILIPRYEYSVKGKRDPFIPLVTKDGIVLKLEAAESKGPVNLEGIIFDKAGSSYAIVNGRVCQVGDLVEGIQLIKIEKDQVTFFKEGNTFVLNLKGDEK